MFLIRHYSGHPLGCVSVKRSRWDVLFLYLLRSTCSIFIKEINHTVSGDLYILFHILSYSHELLCCHDVTTNLLNHSQQHFITGKSLICSQRNQTNQPQLQCPSPTSPVFMRPAAPSSGLFAPLNSLWFGNSVVEGIKLFSRLQLRTRNHHSLNNGVFGRSPGRHDFPV